MKFKIPIFDTTVDTSDPSESAANLGGAVVGGAMLFGIAAAARYVFNRASATAGNNPDSVESVTGV